MMRRGGEKPSNGLDSSELFTLLCSSYTLKWKHIFQIERIKKKCKEKPTRIGEMVPSPILVFFSNSMYFLFFSFFFICLIFSLFLSFAYFISIVFCAIFFFCDQWRTYGVCCCTFSFCKSGLGNAENPIPILRPMRTHRHTHKKINTKEDMVTI